VDTEARVRVLIYAPDFGLLRWIESTFDGTGYLLQIARTVPEIVRIAVDDPPPRPQVLVADFDAIAAADLLGLHAIRDRGWFGAIVALGVVSAPLCSSLNIHTLLKRPLNAHHLRDAVVAIGVEGTTTRIPTFRRP
jgi:hypothetical protein